MREFDITDHGAAGDGITLDTVAIQSAIDTCAGAGGGRVLVPSGRTFVAGSFKLRANVELHIERGAVLRSATREEDFPLFAFTTGAEAGKRLWIGGREAHNAAITGGGVIDGNCHAFSLEEGSYIHTKTLKWRPAMTCFEGCRGFTVRDVTLRNAANWALHFSGCEDVVVDGIRIYNDLKFPNCDGIDPDHCRNVRISNCHIQAADDCIVLKNTEPFARYGPTENVTVTNCTLISTSAAIKIGTESVDDFRNLVFTNCVIRKSNRGLSIQLRDKGNVENVIFSNMTIETRQFHDGWWGAGEVIHVSAVPRSAASRSGPVSGDGAEPGFIRNVLFSNILCEGENGIFIMGETPGRVRDIRFDKIRLRLQKKSRWPRNRYDLRPCEPSLQPHGAQPVGEVTPWGAKSECETAAVFVENADGVSFTDCAIHWDGGIPEAERIVLKKRNVTNFRDGGMADHG